jgi:hypothetical protein
MGAQPVGEFGTDSGGAELAEHVPGLIHTHLLEAEDGRPAW